MLYRDVMSFKRQKNRTRFYVTRATLPAIKRYAWNHLLMLGSNERSMLFLWLLKSVLQVWSNSFASVWGRQKKRFVPSADVSDWKCTGLAWYWDRSTSVECLPCPGLYFMLSRYIWLASTHKSLLILLVGRIECLDELRIESFCLLIKAKEHLFSKVFRIVEQGLRKRGALL